MDKKSDYILASDLYHKNVGFNTKGDIQVLDFGYPRKLGVGYVGDNRASSMPTSSDDYS